MFKLTSSWKKIVFIIFTLISFEAKADQSMVSLNVSVTVVVNNCQINSNQPVKAEFGTVLIDDIGKSTADIPVTVTCDSKPSGTLTMAINGDGSTFNKDALKTDTEGLGITIFSPYSKALKLNTFYDVSKDMGLFSKTGTFHLKAGLVSDGKTALNGGDFNASATLIVQVN